eukprot:TRINITY_DN10015_c0_g2_i1.p1 TRINITY_DN10015_c0_g2~~TRINITY_DN10015_c0_g2_i1.p1  ORF type:complete len:214 (+),score=47.96 TRINITY_DN10015_c0_g2_i1:55-642(+)
MPLCRLRDMASAAFECLRDADLKQILPKRKSNEVTALTSPVPQTTSQPLPKDDDPYHHLRALLAIPAERDGFPGPNVPGMTFQEERNPCLANGTGQKSSSNQQIDLKKMADEALFAAAAAGKTFPWENRPVHDRPQVGEKKTEGGKASPFFDQTLPLETRLQAWDWFVNADLECQNGIRCCLGLPALEAEENDAV